MAASFGLFLFQLLRQPNIMKLTFNAAQCFRAARFAGLSPALHDFRVHQLIIKRCANLELLRSYFFQKFSEIGYFYVLDYKNNYIAN